MGKAPGWSPSWKKIVRRRVFCPALVAVTFLFFPISAGASTATNRAGHAPIVASPLVGALLSDGTFIAKEGGLSTSWVDEHSGVRQIALASDATHGPLVGALLSDGTFIAKEGGLSTSWVDEENHVGQIAPAANSDGSKPPARQRRL
jgi:hypothetical protein